MQLSPRNPRALCLTWLAGLAWMTGPVMAEELSVERVAIYMRHGTRSPTKAPPAGPGIAADPWQAWSVPPGWLTAHGAAGIRVLGTFDRSWLVRSGILPAQGCPPASRVWLHSDSDQRTIVTGDEWLATVAPGCPLTNDHVAQGEPDPLFARADDDPPREVDATAANAAVASALGPQGVQGLMASWKEPLATLDRILCGKKTTGCGLSHQPTILTPATGGKGPQLEGALPMAARLAQVLVLEYTEGLPMSQVGWGRATPQDIEAVGVLHSGQYLVVRRPPYLAAGSIKPIARRLLAALSASEGPALTAIMGHDTGVASLAGLLDLHWKAPGYAADDPPPGGALVFERLRNAKGEIFVRVKFRAQSLEQLRTLAPLDRSTYFATLPIRGCGTVCPLAQFQQHLEAVLAPAWPRS